MDCNERDIPIIQKAKRKKLIVLDKDGTIQSNPHPVEHPSESEISAGKEIRRRLEEYAVMTSSAQTLELGMDSGTYARSVAYGFKRLRPKIRLPDGTLTHKPEEVREWGYLLNFDAFNGFGTGIYVLKNGGYICDRDYETLLGGPQWRPQAFEMLDRLYKGDRYKRNLSSVDRADADIDVAPLEYRIQFDHHGDEGYAQREELHSLIATGREDNDLNLAFVDESNLKKSRYTTYVVPKYGQKERALERFGNQLSFRSGVPMDEMECVIVGDSPTDLKSGLQAFQGAAQVTFILAADSRLTEPLYENFPDFAGISLLWNRKHPDLPARYKQTRIPGVYWYRAHRLLRPRKVILAGIAPWSKGLGCTESVLACLCELGF
ncbi:MAG: hypothetical protein KGH79_02210 [Patescibacteria group bacterium]|nr:hypothetical protein [Patescibacteria group bacterium]